MCSVCWKGDNSSNPNTRSPSLILPITTIDTLSGHILLLYYYSARFLLLRRNPMRIIIASQTTLLYRVLGILLRTSIDTPTERRDQRHGRSRPSPKSDFWMMIACFSTTPGISSHPFPQPVRGSGFLSFRLSCLNPSPPPKSDDPSWCADRTGILSLSLTRFYFCFLGSKIHSSKAS